MGLYFQLPRRMDWGGCFVQNPNLRSEIAEAITQRKNTRNIVSGPKR